MLKANPHALPEDKEEMVTFYLGEDGSISECRKDDQHWEYGTDRAAWPTYIQAVADYMARARTEEGWPDTAPRFWIARVKELDLLTPEQEIDPVAIVEQLRQQNPNPRDPKEYARGQKEVPESAKWTGTLDDVSGLYKTLLEAGEIMFDTRKS